MNADPRSEHPFGGYGEARAFRTKDAWRDTLSAARRAVPAATRAAEAEALTLILRELAGELAGATVCAYLPVRTEPGSIACLESLREAGVRVLLPVVVSVGPLDWAEFTGPQGLRRGPFGLREPASPRLGVEAIGRASLLLVPALAVDRAGVRLGRGGGYYDRSLPGAHRAATVAAVVRDEEHVDVPLPAEPHDMLMTSVLTPHGGLRRLPQAGDSASTFA
ncbi:5-formyltetrahydrofolate cyclo-ligase [Actinoalloteichus hoggarensis]|uniref:5-formyltetrahydrofolate cyclo-ligase n=1 Tax=Actinoalloteichus hoggarensis TaxID=1470176 RepID=A0A221VYF7_9PSEU|nr:5-formyltetrahydrofolate cyclo-ligase [Actinoalloteichus hoggarensis]ASO18281.1 5-formyltetrahydrofolate cyclo-ligase family protein [Actinoalloteichus hoggarensis]MBB5921643.1 5-formyltetrahydrofolate cyclo-ligase [Actinoalloteichus hoggarensis]